MNSYSAALWKGLFPAEVLLVNVYYSHVLKNVLYFMHGVDSDQTPRSVSTDLGLDCLPMSHFWDARHTWNEN